MNSTGADGGCAPALYPRSNEGVVDGEFHADRHDCVRCQLLVLECKATINISPQR